MPLTKVRFRENCLKKIKNLPKCNKRYRDFLLNKKLLDQFKGIKNKGIKTESINNIEDQNF